MKAKQYHTVGTVPKYNRKAKNTTLSEQFQNLTEKQKNTTLSEQFQNLTEKQKNTTMSEQF
jgi:hypothetical protein